MTTITGGCLCKAVRYEISSEPITARACWCRLCQYLGAGSGTVNAVFKKDTVKYTGALTDYADIADSGSHMHRWFCPTCGTAVFSTADERPQFMVVRAGTLDDPNVAKPAMTIWTAQAPSWACISETLPKNEGQPPPMK